jgi:uncharacterized damage-inducible protein DinB
MNKEWMAGEVKSAKEYFDRSSKMLADAHSGFTPREGMMTVAHMIAHVAQTVDWFVEGAFNPSGFNMDFEKMDREARACATVSAARAWLDSAITKALAAIEGRSDAEWNTPLPPGPIMGGLPRWTIIGAIGDHTAHHRGSLTVYARLQGLVPPMPYMDM